MKKILNFDIETTGLNCYKHEIIQFAAIYQEGGEVKDQINIFSKPEVYPGHFEKITELTGIEKSFLEARGMDQAELYKKITEFLNKKIDRYDKKDKIVLSGYNIMRFDINFLRELFKKNNDKYFGSFFYNAAFDIFGMVGGLPGDDLKKLENFRLETLAAYFGIDIKAHDALSDVKATMELKEKILQKIK